jgi:hypothetical protein
MAEPVNVGFIYSTTDPTGSPLSITPVAWVTFWVNTTNGEIRVWNGSAWAGPDVGASGGIWIIAPFIKGTISEASMQVLVHIPTELITIPATAGNLTKAKAKVAATGTTTFTIHKNGGSSFGTIVWSASGTLGAITVGSATSFDPAEDDWLEIIGPETPDATLAHIGISLHATR